MANLVKLQQVRNPDVVYFLKPGFDYAVGRKSSDILLKDDQSVSKKHASLAVRMSSQNLEVTVTDLGSKFGTFVQDCDGQSVKLEANKPAQCANGRKVKFGMLSSEWIVNWTSVVVTTSTAVESKEDLMSWVADLGGRTVANWTSDCTHLVMDTITCTVKVVCSLASEKPIVMASYFKDLLASVETKQVAPDPASYIPPISDSGVPKDVTFRVVKRAKLFDGMTFVFPNDEEHEKLALGVICAGGQTVTLGTCKMSKADLVKDGIVVVDMPDPPQQSTTLKDVQAYLMSNRKRLVHDFEIGMAVLYNSIQHYCNPGISIEELPSNPSQFMTPVQVKEEVESNCSMMDSDAGDALSGVSSSGESTLKRKADFDNQNPSKRPSLHDSGWLSLPSASGVSRRSVVGADDATQTTNGESQAIFDITFRTPSIPPRKRIREDSDEGASKRVLLHDIKVEPEDEASQSKVTIRTPPVILKKRLKRRKRRVRSRKRYSTKKLLLMSQYVKREESLMDAASHTDTSITEMESLIKSQLNLGVSSNDNPDENTEPRVKVEPADDSKSSRKTNFKTFRRTREVHVPTRIIGGSDFKKYVPGQDKRMDFDTYFDECDEDEQKVEQRRLAESGPIIQAVETSRKKKEVKDMWSFG